MTYIFLARILSHYVILISLTQSGNPNPPRECDETLMQTDFESGTYRITEGNTKYCLGEDIVFNPLSSHTAAATPNTPFDSCFPRNPAAFPGCDHLAQGPFALGFFAAITIEADDVELDLASYEIKMSKGFYIQQRTFTIIEIGFAPFITGQGPANFGTNDGIVSNTYIHDGILGLTSHSGLHSNHAQNITIENLRVCDFETAGIQFNGFLNLKMSRLIIGPSSTEVLPCGYYSNAKFLSLALDKMKDTLDDPDTETITFSGDRTKSITQIYDDLITSLDIAYRYFLQQTTVADEENALYDISIELYSNPMQIPDGSSMYGIILNSRGVGVDGFGQSPNVAALHGENVRMSNIKISDLKLNNNEIPAVYFDQCIDPGTSDKSVLKGPFGDMMDIRRMVGENRNGQVIDLGDDFTKLCYEGNPLSDAQIALGIFGERININLAFGSQGQNGEFLKWALDEYDDESYHTLPPCVQFVCNGDIMFHTNKGVMGLRMDNIEDVVIENIVVKKLMNKSPLSSYACGNYSGVHDGGTPGSVEQEGGMGTDVKGIAITGGDTTFDGYNNVIQKLVSYNGDVIGLNLKRDAQVDFDYVFKDELPPKDDVDTEDDRAAIHIKQLAPGHEITFALLAELMVDQKYPYPNNFFACNILVENKESASMIPYPPNGVDKVWCADYVPDNTDAMISQVLPVEVDIDAEENESETSTQPPGGLFAANAAINLKESNIDILLRNKRMNDATNTIKKYPNMPYIYFVIGLICIIMVVFVLVTFIMKCGKIMMNENRKSKIYAKASFDDTEDDTSSDDTDYEENQQI